MSVEAKVPIFFQTTDAVGPRHAFAYWRDAVLSAATITPFDPDVPFSASRMVAPSARGTLLRTVSAPVGVDRTARHIGRDGHDDIAIMLVAGGRGFIEQGSNDALLGAGDVAFHATGKPGTAGSSIGYDEIRLSVPRAIFAAQIGNPQDLIGTKLSATPLRGLLSAHLDAFATSVSAMSEAQAGIAIEGALHILRGIVQGRRPTEDRELSVDAVRSLPSPTSSAACTSQGSARCRWPHPCRSPEAASTPPFRAGRGSRRRSATRGWTAPMTASS